MRFRFQSKCYQGCRTAQSLQSHTAAMTAAKRDVILRGGCGGAITVLLIVETTCGHFHFFG